MASSQDNQMRHTLFAATILVWIALVLGLYYWVHKPINPPFARAVAGAFLDMGSVLVLTLVSAGLGWYVLRWTDCGQWHPLEKVAIPPVIGFGLLSLMLLLVGLVALTWWSVLSLLVVVAGLTFREIATWFSDIARLLKVGLPPDGLERFLGILVLLLVVSALVISTLPPTKFDVLTYHLAGPEQYVENGRFYAIQHNHFLGFPQTLETLYAGQLTLTRQITGGGVLHWMFGVLMLMTAGGFVARKVNAVAGWVTVSVLLSALSVWMEMTFAYVDLLPMALMAVGLVVVDQWVQAQEAEGSLPHWRYVALLGMLSGIGMGTKYSVLWMAASFGVLVLWRGRREGWRRLLIYLALYGAVATLVFLPWLVRNGFWYGNPLHPFVFESVDMDTIRQEWYRQPESGLIFGSNAWLIPTFPLGATILGLEGSGLFGATVGPLFLVLAPVLWLVWSHVTPEERELAQYAGLTAAIVGVAWFSSATFGSYISFQTRLVFYMFVPLAVLAGVAFVALRRMPKSTLDLGFVVQAMVVFSLVLTAIEAGRFLLDSGVETYYSGRTTYRADFLRDKLGWHYETMHQLSTRLPRDSGVRFLWEPRYLYCDMEVIHCRTDSLMDAWYYARRTLYDSVDIAAEWREDGTDYLLVYEAGRRMEAGEEDEDASGNALYAETDWAAWKEFVDEYLVETWRGEDGDGKPVYILYRWQD